MLFQVQPSCLVTLPHRQATQLYWQATAAVAGTAATADRDRYGPS